MNTPPHLFAIYVDSLIDKVAYKNLAVANRSRVS